MKIHLFGPGALGDPSPEMYPFFGPGGELLLCPHAGQGRGAGTGSGHRKQCQRDQEGQIQNRWEEEEDKIGDEEDKGLRQGRVAWH